MPPLDPLGLVTNLATLAQMLRGLLADVASRRAVIAGTARAALDHFGEDAKFVTEQILERDATVRALLAPPSAGRLADLSAQFEDAYAEQPDRVTGRERLGERVAAFVRDVDEMLLEHGVHEAQALGRKIETARADLGQDIAASEKRVLEGQEQLQAHFDRQEVSTAEVLRELRALGDPDAAVKAQFEALRGVAGRGRVEVATEEALELRGGLRPDAPAELRARFGRFIGTGLLALAETERAVDELERALADSPDDPDLLLNAAGANLLVGRFQRAHNLARKALGNGKQDEAIGVLVQTTYWLEGVGAAEALASDHDAVAGAATALGLGFVFQREGRYVEAEALLRPHLPATITTVGDAQVYSELAAALVGGTLQTLRAEQPVPWLQPAGITAALEEAEAHLTAAIAFLDGTDYRSQLARDLANRGLVRNLFWHDARALGDHRRALELEPQTQQYRINLSRYHLIQDDFDAAADVLLVIPEDERSYEVNRLLGEARHLAGRSKEALPFLEAAAGQAVGTEELVPVLAFMLDVQGAEGDFEASARLEAQLVEVAPDDPDTLAVRAHAAFRRNDPEAMVGLYERALAQPGGHHAVRLDYANRLYKLERWQQAAEQYAQVVTLDAFEATTHRYAVALLKAGRRKDALDFSCAVRERYGVRLGVAEVEAHVLRWVGDAAACAELWRAVHALAPDSPSGNLGLAEALVLARDFPEARTMAEQIDWRGLGRAEDVMRLAQLRQMLGLPDALVIAWEALRLAPSDPDIHRGFTSLALQWDGDASPADLEVVVPDSVATLEREDGTTFTVSILSGRSDLREGEVAPDSPQARRLLGQHVQSEVEWGRQVLARRTVRVQSVTPVLVHAVRDSLTSFGERFPDHAGPVMYRGDSPQETANTLVQVLTEMAEATRPLVEQCLRDPRLPLRLLAHKVLGLSFHQFRYWARSAPDRHLHAFDGQPRRVYRQQVRVQSAKRIVIDDTALLTLAELGLLGTLTERFDEVVVPTSLLLSLDGLVMEHTGRLEPETVTVELSLVLQVRAWVLEHAIPLPVYSRLTLAPDVMDRTEDVLGDPTADALFLARELGVPLFSDDLGLNLMAEKEWQVRPTDTLQHLQELHARKRLSFAAYVEQLSSLSRWHYGFIGVSANVLTQAFRDEPKGADFPQLTSELASPRANKASALEVGADTVLALLDIRDVNYRLCLRAIRTILDVLAERIDAKDVALHMVRRVLLRRLDEPAAQSIYLEMFRVILWDWVSERGLLDEPA